MTRRLARELVDLSRDIGRIVAVLMARNGKIEHVCIGDHQRVYLPDIGRSRAGGGRLRGLRLIRTTLNGKTLTSEDLGDLSKLRLDLVLTLPVEKNEKSPQRVAWSHLVPTNPDGKYWDIIEPDVGQWCEFDFKEWIGTLEEEFTRKSLNLITTGQEPAILLYVKTPQHQDHQERIQEMSELCRTAGIQILETVTQNRGKLHPRFAMGPGKMEDIVQKALQAGAEFLIFGCDLKPSQIRHITDMTDLKVLDRTQVILDIFALHARSKGGKLQVELAQLRYTLPRLSGRNTAMSRLAGGIGGRGPGEQKLEVDRRRVRERIGRLETELKKLGEHRERLRQKRRNTQIPTIALVGYTNAGKSTLLNTLTQSDVLVQNKLFATLRPTSRRLRFPREQEVVMTDTVGFIRDLPQTLIRAFRATLEEMEDADVLLHLVDANEADFHQRILAVRTILEEIGFSGHPEVLCFNKIDLLDPEDIEALTEQYQAIPISAHRPDSTSLLVQTLQEMCFPTKPHGKHEEVS
ncbi:MAG: GTPase HflX [Planctomycetota bacterium]|nr:GTPase HflX [Planctomycetota bacterium]